MSQAGNEIEPSANGLIKTSKTTHKSTKPAKARSVALKAVALSFVGLLVAPFAISAFADQGSNETVNSIETDGQDLTVSDDAAAIKAVRNTYAANGPVIEIVAEPEVEEAEAAPATETAPVAEAPAAAPAAEAASTPAGSINEILVQAAMAQLGVAQDCTALVSNALAAAGINFHGWPADYAALGTIVTDPQPGDIAIQADGGMGMAHVAIYIGNGQAVHGGFGGSTQIGGFYGSAPYFVRVGA